MDGPRTESSFQAPAHEPTGHEPSYQSLGGAPRRKEPSSNGPKSLQESNLTTTKRKHRITLHKTIINDPVTTDATQEEEQ